MKLFAEDRRVESGIVPQSAAGGLEAARLDLSKSNAVAILIEVGVGVATTLDLTLRQHDAAAAGNSLDLISTVPHYFKAAASSSFTRVDGTTAVVDAGGDLDLVAGTIIVEVEQDDLAEGYRYLSLVVADPGAAKIVSVSYIVDTKNKPAYNEVY